VHVQIFSDYHANIKYECNCIHYMKIYMLKINTISLHLYKKPCVSSALYLTILFLLFFLGVNVRPNPRIRHEPDTGFFGLGLGLNGFGS